jgi:hypothetical protein
MEILYGRGKDMAFPRFTSHPINKILIPSQLPRRIGQGSVQVVPWVRRPLIRAKGNALV